MFGTFISYRREDAAGYAGRLRESLERRLGVTRVFRDVDTLQPGQDFVQAIEARLAECRVMLAVIGREWVDLHNSSGARRLDEPYDFVRLEIAAALARPGVLVVPVLVEGATMPGASDLPDNLRPLARRHAVSVRDETWDADVERLIEVIENAEADGAAPRHRRLAHGAGWTAAGLAVVLVAALVFAPRRDSSTEPAEPGAAGSTPSAEPSPPPQGLAFAPYTIDIPRVAEVAFGALIYSLVAGNVVSRGDTNELRLRFRMFNYGHDDANFWDHSFRLAVAGELLSPTSDLNEVVPANSLGQGIVTFRIRPPISKAVLRVLNGSAVAEISLDASSTGRAAVDLQAATDDSMARAILRAVSSDPVPLLDGSDVNVTLVSASSRRFANTLRLILLVRLVNHGRDPLHSGGVTLRVAVDDAVLAPWEFPNEVIDPMSTRSTNVVFDLPTAVTRAMLHTSTSVKAAEYPLQLR